MSRQRLVVLGVVLAVFTPLGAARAADKEVKILQQWVGLYPTDKLELLPKGQREAAVGYLGDAKSFEAVWKAWKPTEQVPEVDFKENLVVFTRNVRFLNTLRIVKVTRNEGTVDVVAIETRSARPIRDRCSLAAAVISRQGVKAIKNGGAVVDVAPPSK